MKKVVFILITLLLANSVFAQKTKPESKRTPKQTASKIASTNDESKLARLAIEAYKKGDYKTAEVYLTRILQKTPDAVSYSLRAIINGLKGNTKGEIADYFQGLSYSFEDPEALWQGGFAFNSNRNADATIAAISKYLKTNSQNAEAYIVRGWAYRVKGNISRKIPEAVADFTKAIELKSDQPLFHYLRGEANLFQSETKAASVDFTNYLKAFPDNQEAIGLRANARMRSGDLIGAVADLDELVKRNPGNAGFLNQRASGFREMENYEKAIEDYNAILAINPKDRMALFFRADSFEKSGNYEKAIASYSELIKQNPNDVSYYYQRVRCYLAVKDKEKAIADYRMILKLSPTDEVKADLEKLLKDN